jgi:hypothetical protein
MSYYRNFSPNPNSTDATLTSPTATSPTPSINDFSSKFYDNNNNININQTDNLKMSSSVSNSITNNNVFLTLKFAYSPTGELVIDMEPTNTNSSDTGLSNQRWVIIFFILLLLNIIRELDESLILAKIM